MPKKSELFISHAVADSPVAKQFVNLITLLVPTYVLAYGMYSIQRLGLLIISISGAGYLYLFGNFKIY